jgi:hypothetical protein
VKCYPNQSNALPLVFYSKSKQSSIHSSSLFSLLHPAPFREAGCCKTWLAFLAGPEHVIPAASGKLQFVHLISSATPYQIVPSLSVCSLRVLVQCSLERPQCAQCIKSKRPCAGYRRELIFISSHKQVEAVQTITTREPPSETDGTQKPMRKEHDKTLCMMSSQTGLAHPTTMTSSLEVLPKRVLPASAYKQQFLNLFICSYIPDDMLNVSRVGRCIFWVPLLLEMPNVPRALEISMLAVCTAKVGRLNGDQALVQESLRLYIRGICELQKALWNPQLMYKDETLAACMALCIYEVLECPQRSGVAYVAHSNGALRLLQLRGAGAHTQGLGHALFLAFRLHGVRGSLLCEQ